VRVVGIDLEPRAFRMVFLDGTAKRWKVAGLASESLPPAPEGEDPQAALAAAVENAFRRLKAPHDPVVATFPAGECVFRNLLLPFKGEEPIRKVLKFESEGHLHHWNIDEIVVDYIPLGEVKGQTNVLVVAAPKAAIRRTLLSCEASGFDPQALDLDGTALFNAAFQTGALPEQGTCLLLHVGTRSSLLLLVEDRALRHVRGLHSGVETMSAAVARDLGLDPAAAASKAAELESGDEVVVDFGADAQGDLEMSPRVVEQGFVAGRRDELAVRLAREVARSTAGVALRQPTGSVLLSGPGASLGDLPMRLSTELGIPVTVFNPLERIDAAIPENDVKTAGPLVPAALGAALKGIGLDATRIDLRREDLRFTRTFDRVKVPLLAALSLLLVALLLENIYVFRKVHDRLRASHEALFTIGSEYAKNFAKIDKARMAAAESSDLLKRLPILKTQVEEKLKSLREKLGHGVDQPMSALEAWRLVFDRIAEVKEELGRFSLDNLKFDTVAKAVRAGGLEHHVEVTLNATFYGSSGEANPRYDRLMNALQGAPWVRNLNPKGVKPVPDQEASVAESVKFDVVVPAPKGEQTP
jgi:type IV pilus assembly protein PilM